MKPANWIGAPRVFIIDDSITDCRLMSNSLLQAGYRVEFATDGRQGLTSVLKNPPQCLILDVILPGLNGYAICRQLRTVKKPSTLPIIIISTKNTPIDQKYALGVGANYYLAKPFSEEALLETVKKMIPGFPRTPLAQTPPSFSQAVIPRPSSSPEVDTLIPYRKNEDDVMLGRNPFAGSAIMSDRNLRRLYNAVDGRKNVRDLARMIELDLDLTLKLLKTLWQQQYIVFYDKRRQLLKEIAIFNNIK